MNGNEFLGRIEDELEQVEAERRHLETLRDRGKQITFWRWKAEVMVRILKLDYMQVYMLPVYDFDLDSPLLKEWFEAGETVEQIVQRAIDTFEKGGCDCYGPPPK